MVVHCCHVGYLDRLGAFGSLADRRFAQINRRLMDCAQKSAAQVMAGNDIERLTSRVELKDATAIRFREIHRISGNRIQYLTQIQRRADRPADITKSAYLLERKLKLACALLDFLKETNIFDGNNRLVSES